MAISTGKDLMGALSKVKTGGVVPKPKFETKPIASEPLKMSVINPTTGTVTVADTATNDLNDYVKNSIANPNYVHPQSVGVTSSNPKYNTQPAQNNTTVTPTGQAVNMNTTQNTQPNTTSGANMNAPKTDANGVPVAQFNQQNIDKITQDINNELVTPQDQIERERVRQEGLNYYNNLDPNYLRNQFEEERRTSGIIDLENAQKLNIEAINAQNETLRDLRKAYGTGSTAAGRMRNAALAGEHSTKAAPLNSIIARLNESNTLLGTQIQQKTDYLKQAMEYRKDDITNQKDAIIQKMSLIDARLTPEQKQLLAKKLELKTNSLLKQDERDMQVYLQKDAQKYGLEKTVFDSMVAAGLDPNSVPVEKRSQLLSIAAQVNKIKEEAKKIAPNIQINRSDAQITADIAKLTEFYVSQGMDRAAAQARAIQENFTNPLLDKPEYAQGLQTTQDLRTLPIREAEARVATAKNEAEYRNATLALNQAQLAQSNAQAEQARQDKKAENETQRNHETKLQNDRLASAEKVEAKQEEARNLDKTNERAYYTEDVRKDMITNALDSGDIMLNDLVKDIKDPETKRIFKEDYYKIKGEREKTGTVKMSTKERNDVGNRFIDYQNKSVPIKKWKGIQSDERVATDLLERTYNKLEQDPNYKFTGPEGIAMLKSFSLITDPESAVRESEYDNLKKSVQGLPATLKEFQDKILNGGLGLSNEGLISVIKGIKDIANSRRSAAFDEYKTLGKQTIDTMGKTKIKDVLNFTRNQMSSIGIPEADILEYESEMMDKYGFLKKQSTSQKSLPKPGYSYSTISEQDMQDYINKGIEPKKLDTSGFLTYDQLVQREEAIKKKKKEEQDYISNMLKTYK